MEHYPIEQAIIVPSTKGKSQRKISKAEFKKRVNNVRRFMAKRYGGFTDTQETGGYVMKNGKLVKEKVMRVNTFAKKKDYSKNKTDLMNQIKRWRKNWGQESIGYEKEGDFYTIECDKKVKRIKKVMNKRRKK